MKNVWTNLRNWSPPACTRLRIRIDLFPSEWQMTTIHVTLLVLGDMSVQGNIKPLRSLTEPLQVAKDNGAKRALIPIENKRNFLDVSADIMESVDPIFYGDPKTAAMKVLGNL